jgi:hypothetical protein
MIDFILKYYHIPNPFCSLEEIYRFKHQIA